MGRVKFRNIGDIEKFENTPLEERLDVFNTYDLLRKGAAINPDAQAISFFLAGDTYDQPMRVTYRDLMANITQTANLFHDLGVGRHDVISSLRYADAVPLRSQWSFLNALRPTAA